MPPKRKRDESSEEVMECLEIGTRVRIKDRYTAGMNGTIAKVDGEEYTIKYDNKDQEDEVRQQGLQST